MKVIPVFWFIVLLITKRVGSQDPQWNWEITIENWLTADIRIDYYTLECMLRGDLELTRIGGRSLKGPGTRVIHTKEDTCLWTDNLARGLVITFKSDDQNFKKMHHEIHMRSRVEPRMCSAHSTSKNFFLDHSVVESEVIKCGSYDVTKPPQTIQVLIRVKYHCPILDKDKNTYTYQSQNALPRGTYQMVSGTDKERTEAHLYINNLSENDVFIYLIDRFSEVVCWDVGRLHGQLRIGRNQTMDIKTWTECGRCRTSSFYFILEFRSGANIKSWAIGQLEVAYPEGDRECRVSSGKDESFNHGHSIKFDARVDYCTRVGEGSGAIDKFHITVYGLPE